MYTITPFLTAATWQSATWPSSVTTVTSSAPGGSTASRNRTPARSGTSAQPARALTSSTAARSSSPTGAPSAVPSSTTTTAQKKTSPCTSSRRTTPARSGLPTGHFPSRRPIPPTSPDPSRTPSGPWCRSWGWVWWPSSCGLRSMTARRCCSSPRRATWWRYMAAVRRRCVMAAS